MVRVFIAEIARTGRVPISLNKSEMTVVDWPALYAEGAKVVEILRPGGSTLIVEQIGKIDHKQRDQSIEPSWCMSAT